MVDKSILATNLANLRELSDYSLAELSKLTGITKPHLHCLETGKSSNPNLETLLALTECYKVDIPTLLGITTLKHSPHIVFSMAQLEAANLGYVTKGEHATIKLALDMAVALIKQNRNSTC